MGLINSHAHDNDAVSKTSSSTAAPRRNPITSQNMAVGASEPNNRQIHGPHNGEH